jgi:neurotrimin
MILFYFFIKPEITSKTGEMIISNDRYAMSETENSLYAVQMILVIRKLHKADMGGYKCISKNSIGDAEGTIRLYGEFF